MRFRTGLKHTNFLIDLTPLVDVTFLMLIFFIITSDILPLKYLNIENPTIDRESPALTTQLLVVMDAQQVVYLGSRKDIIDLSSLRQHLEEEIAHIQQCHSNMEPTIVLSVDRRVEYGAFLRMFSIAQQCGPRVRLVYRTEGEEGSYL
jgi:biopolymer transport protein ExbD